MIRRCGEGDGEAGEEERLLEAILRFGYAPLRGMIETVGAMVLLFRRTVLAALTPPFNYGPELVDQFLFAMRLGWFPMISLRWPSPTDRPGSRSATS